MENNKQKELWIDEVLRSTEGMSRAQPKGDVYDQIIPRLNSGGIKQSISTSSMKWAAAAVLLIGINAGTVLYNNRHQAGVTATNMRVSSNPIASAIQEESTYNY